MSLEPPKLLDESKAGLFRYRSVAGKVLITNDTGHHAMLEPEQFRRFAEGGLKVRERLHRQLSRKGFIRDHSDFAAMVDHWRRRNGFLFQGPSLHILVVTLRCNHKCVYCQTSVVGLDQKGFDMSEETARTVVDTAFSAPGPALTLEFQGGEPLANWPVVRFVVDYALEKNRAAQKRLSLNLVTNLSLMDEERLKFLLERGVNFCTSLDGPPELHDANRVFLGGSSHENVMRWWKRIYRGTAKRPQRIDALMTTTRLSLAKGKEIVDEYVRIGARSIYLRPLQPYGFAARTWETIGYSTDEFLRFYRESLDYILELNFGGRPFIEQTAALFAAKILRNEDPGFLDLRSPCGAGIGQLAYNYDGRIYTCDEGRMLSRMSDETFCLGEASATPYAKLAGHPTVRAMASASCLESQAECSSCAYMPYCGTCPVQNYVEHGDLFPRTPVNSRCRLNKGVLDALFERLEDPRTRRVVLSWTRRRWPQHLYQRQ